MNPSMIRRAATTLLAALLSACGGDGDSTAPDGSNNGGGGGTGNSRFTAKVDGVAWASDAGSERVGVPITVAGLYALSGAKIGSGANNYVIVITLYNIPGPGTYPLGVGPQIVGGNAQISNATSGWSTPSSGAAGSITISVLTASRIEGTFNFTATPFSLGRRARR